MFNVAYRIRWADDIRLEYWRQVIRLTRLARQLKAWVLPIQGYLWLPAVAGLAGAIGGLLFTLLF